MAKKSIVDYDLHQWMNEYSLLHYYMNIKSMVMTSFDWQGFPDNGKMPFNVRFMEQTLFDRGLAVFYYDAGLSSYLALPATPSQTLNHFGEPIEYTVKTPLETRTMSVDECVPIYNNYVRTPSSLDAYIFANRLAQVSRTIDVNTLAQKHPMMVVVGSEGQRMTLESVIDDYMGNKPVIIGYEGLVDAEVIKAIDTGAPFKGKDLYELFQSINQEMLEFFGFNSNPFIDKRERVTTSEIDSNNELVDAASLTYLQPRRDAASIINDRWGLDVKVVRRSDYQSSNFELLHDLQLQSEADLTGGVNG